MWSSWTIWVGSESNNKCPLRDTQKRNTWGEQEMATWRWRGRLEWCSHAPVSTWGHQEMRGKEWFSPRAFGGSVALSTPWFWTCSPQNYGRIHLCYVQSPSEWYFVTAATGNSYTQRSVLFHHVAYDKLLPHRELGDLLIIYFQLLLNIACCCHIWIFSISCSICSAWRSSWHAADAE